MVAWGLSLIVCLGAMVAWGQRLGWNFDRLSVYRLFPLFGLLAFSLMWSHYGAAALRQWLGLEKSASRTYFEWTAWAVLVFILLHPSLLIFQLWRDGFGLPPQSYLEHYVAPTLKWAAALGSLSLLVFLAYELRHWFEDRGWWHYVQIVSDVAMVAVFIHGLRLGTHTGHGWFRSIWLFYGVSLLGFIALRYYAPVHNIIKGSKKEPT